ncbi:MAG TPA: hypothetical protein VEI01_04265 [Terriglobales bacterium]|nr:hypothetical protein [Terriglobales bacterium]
MDEDQPSHYNDRAPAMLFDLDGTLIDSVYQHVLACEVGIRTASS